MAYGTKYRCEFKDNAGLLWKWDFEWDGYAGSVTDMKAAGDPMEYEPLSESDDLYEYPVRGTKATLRVLATSLQQYSVFSTVNPLEIRCSIYYGASDTLFFRGYIQPGMYEEAYNDYPFAVNIVASDGLSYLKDIDYTPTTAGRVSELNILLYDILPKIGASGFNEIVNIYETNMSSATTDSPINQTYIDTDVFEDMNCYEALEYMLKKWKAIIRQWEGVFWIYRPKEMTTTAYVRKFSASGIKTTETVNYVQYLSRTGLSSDLRDFNGGAMLHLASAKNIHYDHDLGDRESWIRNYELSAETFDGDDFEDWLQLNDAAGAKPVSEYVPGEQNGVAIISGNDDYHFQQSFSPNAKTSINDSLVLEFDWGLFNNRTTTVPGSATIKIVVKQGSRYLVEISDTLIEWSTDYSAIGVQVLAPEPGWTGWTHWRRQVTSAGITQDDEILIALYPEWDDKDGTLFPCLRDIKFYTSSKSVKALTTNTKLISDRRGQSTLKNQKIQYFRELVTNIKIKQIDVAGTTYGEEIKEDHILGDITVTETSIDNVLEQFKGSLAYAEVTDPHAFNIVFIRNAEMDLTLSVASSTMLAISNKVGQVITVNNLPDYEKFDIPGWAAMLIDEDKTTTTDPTATGDYTYKNFVTINRSAKTLTFPAGYDLSAWEVGDNLAVYNPFLNYSFVGDQTQGPIISLTGAPAWRSLWSINGGMFRHSDGRFIWIFAGWDGTGYSIGYTSTTDFITWTIGNSDAPIIVPGDFADCYSCHQAGSVTAVENSPGDYWCIIILTRTSDGKNETRIMYFDEDFTTITFSANPILATTPYYGTAGGGIVKIGSYYHVGYLYINQVGADREIRVAKSATLEGPYTDYQTILAGTSGVNDAAPWSNNVDNFGLFYDGAKYYGLVGATSKWSESGNKGNREQCLLDFDENTETWSFSTKGMVIINPLYYQDINSTYLWCGDHVGGYFAMFVDGTDIYLSLTMKGSVYQAALFKFNNIGLVKPTATWARRGVTESKELLQITCEEHALQRSAQRQLIANYPVLDRAITDINPHLNILGTFVDVLNTINGGIGGMLITSLYNSNGYATFETTGTTITSAINTSGTHNGAGLPALSVVEDEIIVVKFTLTLNSGGAPYLSLYQEGIGSVANSVPSAAGINEIELICTQTTSGCYLIISNTAASNYSTSEIIVSRKPRKFAFNRGVYKAKERLWDMDIVEIKE